MLFFPLHFGVSVSHRGSESRARPWREKRRKRKKKQERGERGGKKRLYLSYTLYTHNTSVRGVVENFGNIHASSGCMALMLGPK